MPKTIHTPRDELICGAIDRAEDFVRERDLVNVMYELATIRSHAERMEAKLVTRKAEADAPADWISYAEARDIVLCQRAKFDGSAPMVAFGMAIVRATERIVRRPPKPHNFCPDCGKRNAPGLIHTCAPVDAVRRADAEAKP